MRRYSTLLGVLCAASLAAAAPASAAALLSGPAGGDPTIILGDPDGNRITINYGDVNNGVISITATINGVLLYEPNVTFIIPAGERLSINPDGSVALSPGDVLIGDPAYPENQYRLTIGGNGREVLQFPTGAQNSLTIVPEPAAWAMMLLGGGLIGGALRLSGRSTKRRPPVSFPDCALS